jgi:hypothetical protein
MSGPWFRRRRIGYGVTPINDKGVAASVIVMILLGLCIGLPTMILGKSLTALIVSAASFVSVLGAFIAVAAKHTDPAL